MFASSVENLNVQAMSNAFKNIEKYTSGTTMQLNEPQNEFQMPLTTKLFLKREEQNEIRQSSNTEKRFSVRKFEQRLKKLEGVDGQFNDVITIIREGTFYDELTPEMKQRYCLYQFGLDHHPEKEISQIFGYDFDEHFRLEYKKKTPTAEDIKRSVEEVEKMIFDIKNEVSD